MGEDLQYRITIEFEEAVFGCEKEIVIEKNESCSSCDGTGSKDKEFSNCLKCGGRGRVIIEHETSFGRLRQEAACDECEGDGKVSKNKCKKCSGRGVVFEKKKIKIKIPRGIDNDQVIRVGGGGNDVKGGISGDLMVVVRVKPHDVFQRDGNNIIVDLELNFSKAALGCKISIPTLHGDEKIKIAPGVESGTILRLRRKGVSDVNGYGVGDQFVNIKVITPKKLNRKQKKLFNELAKLEE